jgi:hypothetical protein
MRKKLKRCNNIEIRRSDKHGYGVFANSNIKSDTILEECRLLFLPYRPKIETLDRYAFPWDPDNPMKADALPTGYGCLYNSSNGSTESVRVEVDEKEDIAIYIASRNIGKMINITLH